MDAFGPSHLIAIAVLLAGVPVVVALGRRERATGDRTASRVLAVAIPLVHVPTQVYDAVTGFELGVTLPLHLCDLAWVAAAVALWTRRPVFVGLTYLWSLLTLQGVVTPSLGEAFPDVRFFAYWALHLLILWAAVFLVAGVGLRPGWREYRWVVGVTLAWAVLTYAFNEVAGTNYGYLQAKPAGGSILDLLGPWPVYIVAEIALVAAVWALMTWPLTRHRADPSATTDGSTRIPR